MQEIQYYSRINVAEVWCIFSSQFPTYEEGIEFYQRPYVEH